MELREGIIVRSQKYQDSSKIITIINENGLDTYLVKGALKHKSKNFSYSNELTKIGFDAIDNKNSFNILTTGNIINNYSSIKADFNKLSDCIIILEITNKLGLHIEDSNQLYSFLDEILLKINNYNYNGYYLLIFRLKLLYLLGLAPVFTKCVVCGSRENLIGFDFSVGGMKCSACRNLNDFFYKEESITVLKYLYLTKLENISNESLNKFLDLFDEVKKFLDRYYDHYLGYTSLAEKVITKFKKL